MSDDQFRQLRTLILDLGVKVEGLALSVRNLERRIDAFEVVEVEPLPPEANSTIYEFDQLDELVKTRRSREPSSDN